MRVRSVGPVVAAGEVADGLGEQPAEELDLFPLPGAAGTEVPPESRAWYSTWFQSIPTSSPTRWPERRSTSAACSATSGVWRCGRVKNPVVKRRRSVMPAG